MSELKSIELLDTINGGNTSFISLELLSLELEDRLTAVKVITDKMQFILNELLELADEIPADYNSISVIKTMQIADKQRGYTDLLADYYQALKEKLEVITNTFIDATGETIKKQIEYKEVKTVDYRDNRNEVK